MSGPPIRTTLVVAALAVLAACGSDDTTTEPADPEPVVVTSTTELPILTGSGRGDDEGTVGADDGEITGATPPPTVSPPTVPPTSDDAPPAAGSDEDCGALTALLDGPDAGLLDPLAARIDGAEPELPDALRVLSDVAAVREARVAGASRMAGMLGITCPGIERATGVSLLGEGLDVAFFDQDRALVSSAVTNVLGFPTLDTGPIDPLSAYGTCPGTQLWAIEWPSLVLLFSDDGEGPESFEFFGWLSFDQGDGASGGGPETPEGISIGDPMAAAATAYEPLGAEETVDVVLDVPLITVPGRYVFVGDGDGVIESIEGGTPCAE